MTDLRARAIAILHRNDRGGYTVPTDGLYPFQWNWDSGFAALGLRTFDEARAWQELRSLLRGQWADGMVPHIVFHQPDPRYYPGPEVWGIEQAAAAPKAVPTSGITQPPMLGVAAWRLLERAAERDLARAAAAELYPKILAWHRWFRAARDPAGTGLVATFHPWETGMDNSPAWDAPLANVPIDPIPPYERRDLGHVAADQRPRQSEYDRYLTLVHRFRARRWDPAALFAETPFRVTDLATNSILLAADHSLLALGDALGLTEGRAELEAWSERGRRAFAALWDEAAGAYRSQDQLTGEPITVGTAAGFLPLFAGVPDQARAARLIATMERWLGQTRHGVPTTDPAAPQFEPRRYWRGPVWLIVNWMIAEGLGLYGADALADRLRADSRSLVEHGGLWEYYHPETGEGLGGPDFTWTSAMVLAWLQ
jgi:alpha,alpha-trehalase